MGRGTQRVGGLFQLLVQKGGLCVSLLLRELQTGVALLISGLQLDWRDACGFVPARLCQREFGIQCS